MSPVIDSDHPVVRVWAEVDSRVVEASCGRVPVFWAEMPAPLRAQLSFRVGRADEPFSRAGISHLVEHLALSTLGERLYAYNGAVSGDMTTFSVAGTEEEVVEFFSLVCGALRRLPLDRLDAERTVLLTEAARRSPDATAALLWSRYGATGFGLLGVDEHGLRAASGDQVQAWADERFTAPNAALIMTGPPPPALEIDLLDGRSFGAPVSEPVPQPLPTAFNRQSSVVGFGATVAMSRAGRSMLGRHLQRAMTQRLRTELGITYSVGVGAVRIDAETEHVTVLADALPEQASAVSSAMYGELVRLAGDGVDPVDVERDVEQMRRIGELPDSVGGALAARLTAQLHGRPFRPMAQAARDLIALQPSDVAAAAADLRDSAMWLLPPGTTLQDAGLRPFVAWSPTPVRADRYLAPRSPMGQDGPVGLAIGEQGVTAVLRGSRFITVRWNQCVGAQSWSTGQWVLFGKDGFRLTLDPQQWDQAGEVQRLVEAHVPERLRIPMGELERTAPAPAPRRRASWRRLLQLGVVILPLMVAVAGWALFFGTSSTPSGSMLSQPAPVISFDPASNDIQVIPGSVPVPATPQPSDLNPGFLVLGIAGTTATIRAARAVSRLPRR